jgi:hypothetical protein
MKDVRRTAMQELPKLTKDEVLTAIKEGVFNAFPKLGDFPAADLYDAICMGVEFAMTNHLKEESNG